MLQTKSNSELDADARQREQDATAADAKPFVHELAAYIRKCFSDAEKHKATAGTKDSVKTRLLKCDRQRDGVYDPEDLAKIAASGGSQQFHNITDTKCIAAESWMTDVLAPAGDRPWTTRPTPIPDLGDDFIATVVSKVSETVAFIAQQTGEEPSPEEIQALTMDVYDAALKALREDAKKRAELLADKMYDQLTEGGFQTALESFIQDLCNYPTAFMKGPVIRKRQKVRYVNGTTQVTDHLVPTWECPSPHDVFPAPNVRSLNDGYICEIVEWDLSELSEMRGQDGYSTPAIEAVISGNLRADTAVTSEPTRATIEGRDTTYNDGLSAGGTRAVEFHGPVQGQMLIDWGMPQIEDPFAFIHVDAVLIGDQVVRCIQSPDVLHRTRYYGTSYRKKNGTVWGKGIPEQMADVQRAVNACIRNALTNLAYASGPMCAADLDALDPACDATKVYPMKVYQYHGKQSPGAREPVRWFQPDSNAGELLKIAEYFEQKADDRTLIPRYAHGNDDVQGAGSTMGGLSMLMNAAAKGIKALIKHVDQDVIRPLIEVLYHWDLEYLPDDEYGHMKGDCEIVARGALSVLVREQTQIRRQEFLNATNNPLDAEIIRKSGRAAVLREIAKDLDLDVDKIIPSEAELLQMELQDAADNELAAQETATQGDQANVVR
jgi:hypothetical protein